MTDLQCSIPHKMRIGLYARVSTTDQDCSQQLCSLHEYVTARRWEIQGEYIDHAVSGTKNSRPAMNRLMEAARRRAIDAVVCWKIDRWGRSMPHSRRCLCRINFR
jgi:DNA invertase Pin-like site-specific DNA recombinase